MMQRSTYLLSLFFLLFLLESQMCFQVGTCRLCAQSCGDWAYGGTFRTSIQHGVFKMNNFYEKGCEKVSQGDDVDEFTQQDILLCCKQLDIDPAEQSENVKSIQQEIGSVLEYTFEDQSARIKAATCRICQESCPSQMVARAFFHLNKIGPFKVKAGSVTEEAASVNKAMKHATNYISIYGFDKQCKNQIKDLTKIEMESSVYSRSDGIKYQFDPQIVMCCDKIGNENDSDVKSVFKVERDKEQCRKDKKDKKIKKKDYKAKCGTIMAEEDAEDPKEFRFKSTVKEDGEEKKKEGEGDKKEGEADKKEGASAPITSATLCSFCRTCDPKVHDTVLASMMIENLPGALVLPKKCKEKVLNPDPYQKKFEIPAQVQLCCHKNQGVYEQIRTEVFGAAQ